MGTRVEDRALVSNVTSESSDWDLILLFCDFLLYQIEITPFS